MVKSNLAVLLAERGLKITKVSEETKISRTTLTALYYNHCSGVQFDTVNTLCKYLGITPGDLFTFAPVDFVIVDCEIWPDGNRATGNFYIEISDGKNKSRAFLGFNCDFSVSLGTLESAAVDVYLLGGADQDSIPEEEIEKANETLIRTIQQIPVIFIKDIEESIERAIESEIEYTFKEIEDGNGDVYGGVSKDCEIEYRFPPEFRR